ncbi:ComEC family competence protein [Flavobacterium sp. SM15]|uniref:ComEC/Rec2 family competence protein n=1 Tax=Flavobacterium sp. SM15 TaxID=2908005 RepID=UPI001ED9DA97|nr:ComEC/Rec2 family competence protein [Flavobacterium sp. SM15]MCG2609969.1 ComEC family competence protein [Flavobacterium sp. SM15]
MKVLKFPIIPISLFFAAGIAYDFHLKPSLEFSWSFSTILLIITAATFFFAKKKFIQNNYYGYSVLATAFVFGALTHSLHQDNKYPNHYSQLENEKKQLIIGTISERLKPNAYSEKYYLKISSINGKPTFGKILLNVSQKATEKTLKSGYKLILSEELQPVANSLNPFQFDYSTYLKHQNVYHQVYVKSSDFKIITRVKNFDYYIEYYREKLLNSFKQHHFSETNFNIIKALLLGQRQDMDSETTQKYTDAGVIHILAISGLHIALLYGMLVSLLKPLERLRKGKMVQFFIAILFLWGFALISGLSASVVRSVVMFTFISWGMFLNQSSNIYNSMATSMLAILLFKPSFLFDVGFQLSYAAVFSIVWLQPLFRIPALWEHKILRYVYDTIVVSLIAQIGVLPISLYYFHQFPTLFLLANLVVIPLSSFILVYAILILIMNFIWAKAALALGGLLSLSIEFMNDYISWIASFETCTLKNIPFTFLLLVSSYIALISIVFWFCKKSANRLIISLTSILLFQTILLYTFWKTDQGKEFIVFNNRKQSLITHKNNNQILVYSNDTLALKNRNLTVYNQGNFNKKIEIKPLQNTLVYNEKRILVIDSAGIYNIGKKPQIVILTQSAKINLERLIKETAPDQIIADGSNYKSYVKRWKLTCEKEKIPFHATAEKGFYTIE